VAVLWADPTSREPRHKLGTEGFGVTDNGRPYSARVSSAIAQSLTMLSATLSDLLVSLNRLCPVGSKSWNIPKECRSSSLKVSWRVANFRLHKARFMLERDVWDTERGDTVTNFVFVLQGVPLPTKPGISLIILKPMKILQRDLNRSTFVLWEMWRHHNIFWKWPPFASRQD
jgi:hypothetical protein